MPPKSSKDLYWVLYLVWWPTCSESPTSTSFFLPSNKLARSECHHDNCTNHSEYDQKHAHPQERKCSKIIVQAWKKAQHQFGTNPQWKSVKQQKLLAVVDVPLPWWHNVICKFSGRSYVQVLVANACKRPNPVQFQNKNKGNQRNLQWKSWRRTNHCWKHLRVCLSFPLSF